MYNTQISVAEDHTQALPAAEPALLSQLWRKLSCVGVCADTTSPGHRVPCTHQACHVPLVPAQLLSLVLQHGAFLCQSACGKLISNGLLHSQNPPPPCPRGRCLGEHQLPEAARGCQCGPKKTPKCAFGRYNKLYLACSLTRHKSASSKETHSSGLVFIPQRGWWSAITTGLQAPSPRSILRALPGLPGGPLKNHLPFLSCKQRMPLNGFCKTFFHI